MILQALVEYYERKAVDPESLIPPEGFEWKEIPFLIVIDREGRFVGFEDTRQQVEGRLTAKSILVPRAESRSGKNSFEITNLFWDHFGYILGLPKSGKDEEREKLAEMAKQQNLTFVRMLNELPEPIASTFEVAALREFYSGPGLVSATNDQSIPEILKIPGCNLTFRIEGQVLSIPELALTREYVSASSSVKEAATPDDTDVATTEGQCLVTGNFERIARTHHKVAINKDNDSLVSFQTNSGYDSYGRTQAFNAPIGIGTEFRYVTALKGLLAKGSINKLVVGDATVVFWGEKKNGLEPRVRSFFSSPLYDKDNPERGIEECRSALNWIRSGIPPEEGRTRFFVLGLSPGGGSRISVRFWYNDTVSTFAKNIRIHFEDLEIVLPSFDRTWLGQKILLKAIALNEEDDKLPPNISGDLTKAVLLGTSYPETLLQQCLRRIRATKFVDSDSKKNDRKNGPIRAAILKACLNRKLRRNNPSNEKEITVSLDVTNTNPGYRLGRLFAVLEKIQEDSSEVNLKSTIRDRFYGAASSNPVTVFPRLITLSHHHLSKLKSEKPAFAKMDDKWLVEIIGGIVGEFPNHMAMDDQARFAIGYYHQRQAFFTKNETPQGAEE
jgi:CRISPR-associated protein Csd1